MATRDVDGKFDWDKTWVADKFASVGDEPSAQPSQRLAPEMRREREIRAGVITASVGIGLMILLFVLMNGIIAGGRVSDAAAEILSRLWIVGVIPFLVGAALVFNGMFVSKRGELPSGISDLDPEALNSKEPDAFLPPADTNELFPAGFSVTDETTKHLKDPSRRRN